MSFEKSYVYDMFLTKTFNKKDQVVTSRKIFEMLIIVCMLREKRYKVFYCIPKKLSR